MKSPGRDRDSVLLLYLLLLDNLVFFQRLLSRWEWLVFEKNDPHETNCDQFASAPTINTGSLLHNGGFHSERGRIYPTCSGVYCERNPDVLE
jgi:hypothetical protein